MAKRYYFHGDEVEGKPEQYYCAYCDLFVNKGHFLEATHLGNDKERYDRSAKGWEVLKKKSDGRLQRPKNASNIFSNLPSNKKKNCLLRKIRG
ncbi:MAG: hypothetical protein JMN26_18745 [gamma proteobacterium endosymbiont of Lamellibrachia anaximandri]|nr:hypothetical protein [gamma proteobacterium endosymbiont of Lamellibrachia anaximandri]